MPRNLNARFSRRDTFRRGGFSLLEVAIALVIFVIGALAIVRIFPGALNVVQGSGNRNLAVNLNRGTLSKFAQEAGSVPRAIYNHDPADANVGDGVDWIDFNGSVAGTPRRNYSLPRTNISDVSDSALSKFRYIFEEGQKVRGQSGNLFLMTNHAIRPFSTIAVSEEDIVEGVTVVDNTGRLDFSESRFRNADVSPSGGTPNPIANYFDNGTGTLAVDVDYYVTYRYKDRINNTPQTRIEVVQDKLVSDTTTWSANPKIPTASGATNIVLGPVEVRFIRKFYVVNTGIIAPLDTMTSPSASTVAQRAALQQLTSLSGYIQLSSTTTLFTKNRPIAPDDNLRVSYVCDAWNWLINDEVATQSADGADPDDLTAVLPVKFIDSEPATFRSIATTVGAAYGIRQSYVAAGASAGTLQLETGSYAEDGTPDTIGIFEGAPTGSVKALRDAFNAGRIFVDELRRETVTNEKNISPSLRVSYRTRDAWAHQVSVAPSTYTRFPIPVTVPPQPRQQWREFYVGSDGDPTDAKKDRYLYFHPSEAGKTLMISYKYGNIANAATTDVEVTARIVTVDEDIIDADGLVPVGFAPLGGKVARALLTDNNGNPIPDPVTTITSIKGLSVQIRTAWLEGSRFTQSSLTGFRQEAGSQ